MFDFSQPQQKQQQQQHPTTSRQLTISWNIKHEIEVYISNPLCVRCFYFHFHFFVSFSDKHQSSSSRSSQEWGE